MRPYEDVVAMAMESQLSERFGLEFYVTPLVLDEDLLMPRRGVMVKTNEGKKFKLRTTWCPEEMQDASAVSEEELLWALFVEKVEEELRQVGLC